MIRYLLTLFLFIGLAACSSISTTSDYNPETDFTSYSILNIYDGVIKNSELENILLAKKGVLEAINIEMQKRG